MTPSEYFYQMVSELTHQPVSSPVSGEVNIVLSDCGQQDDQLFVGGQLVAKGARASLWYSAAPADICV